MSASERVRTLLRDNERRLVGVLVAIAVLFPLASPGAYLYQVSIRVLFLTALVASWNLIGYTGYINFGQAAFYGIGAYVLGTLMQAYGLPIPVAALAGGLVAAVAGLALGLITLRLRGHYFSITSLMLLFVISVAFTNFSSEIYGFRTGGPVEQLLASLGNLGYYYLFLFLALVVVGFSYWLENTKWGYGMLAINEDEDIALSIGVPTTYLKVLSLTLSAFFAGVIGAFHGQFFGYIDVPTFFSIVLTFDVVFMGFVGSMGRWYGPVIGVSLFVPVNEALTALNPGSPELARIVYGALFVVIILNLPKGIGRYFVDWLRGRDREMAEGPAPEGSAEAGD